MEPGRSLKRPPVPPEILAAADAELAQAFRRYTLAELRYDWCCNLAPRTKQLILGEVKRRKVPYEEWTKLGRGERRGGPFLETKKSREF